MKPVSRKKEFHSIRPIPTFTASESDKGFEFMMAGCLPMRKAPNMPAYVRGMVQMEDRNIPVVDLDAKAGKRPKRIGETACIVLFEHHQGDKTVKTGAIFRNVDELLEKIRSQTPSETNL